MALSSVASVLITPQISDVGVPKPHLPPHSHSHRYGVLCRSAQKSTPPSAIRTSVPPVYQMRARYRKLYPGETGGITEEMRFVAINLRNIDGKYESHSQSEDGLQTETGIWNPSIKGFVKHLVDSKLVFDTVERIVHDSTDVAFAYFRNSGLERSQRVSRDLEWFREQGYVIPEPGNPGVSYSAYLEKLAVKSAPLFLCHFYNIYFSHIAAGQVIGRQVSEKILDGRELELYQWEGEATESFRTIRDNLNNLSQHWDRKVKNRCLNETKKSFRYLGAIVRLIIL